MLKTGKVLLGLLMALLIEGTAFADKKQDFQEAYQAYQRYMIAGDGTNAREMASESYRLGAKVYGKKDPNTAKLAINYAGLLNDAGSFRAARKVLKGKLKVMEGQYGVNATELSTILIELGRATFNPSKPSRALNHFSRASRVLENHDSALYRAKKNFDIAVILLKREGSALTQPYIEAAHGIYSRELPATDFRRGLTSYHMARHAIEQQLHENAVEYLKMSLDAFKSADAKMGDLERTVRTQLVESLEELQRHELATEHCLALGSRQEWKTPISPLYSKDPLAPPEAVAAGLTGEVTLAFAVDEKGHVVNPRIAHSTEAAFDQAALDMIRRFRYAPRFVDGRPVLTGGLEFTVRFAPAQVEEERRRTPGFDGFGGPPPRWRLEQTDPGSEIPGPGKGGGGK